MGSEPAEADRILNRVGHNHGLPPRIRARERERGRRWERFQ